MKNTLLIALMLGLSLNLFAQKVIENPYCKASNEHNLSIDKVVLNKEATLLTFTYKSKPEWWFSIPATSYITYGDGVVKLVVKGISDSLKIGDRIVHGATGQTTYTLTFPPIDTAVTLIDFDEGEKGSWYVYDISLSGKDVLNYIADDFLGDWMTVDANTSWEVSFAEDLIIYKGQPYDKFDVKEKNGSYKLSLEDKLVYARMEDGKLFIGENKKTLHECEKFKSNTPQKGVAQYPIPEFKMNQDTASYYGYLSNYTSKKGNTGYVAVDNILTHEQDKYLIHINENGWFEVKLPLYYAQDVYFRLPGSNYSAFLVPGETLTQLINKRQTESLGKYAQFADEHKIISTIARSYDYRKVREKIGTMSIADYKDYCENAYREDIKKWADFCEKWAYNEVIKGIGERDITMMYVVKLWSYSMNKNSFARQEKKKGNAYEFEEVDSSYYSIINDLEIDNEAMLSWSSHSSFVNRIEYAEWLRIYKTTYNNDSIFNQLLEDGLELTDEERAIVEKRKAESESELFKQFRENTLDLQDAVLVLIKNNVIKVNEFNANREKKYADVGYYVGLKTFLINDSTVTLSDEDIYLLEAMAANESPEYIKANNEFNFVTQKAYSKIFLKYSSFFSQESNRLRADYKSKKFLEYTGEKGELMSDIMVSRMICPNIKKPAPLSPSILRYVDENIKSEFIKNYIIQSNKEVIEYIECNKKKTG